MSVTISGSGSVPIQVASTTVNTAFSASLTTTYINFTGLSVNITPRSSSNKILILVTVANGGSGVGTSAIQVTRNGTVVGNGTGAALVNSASAGYAQGSTGYSQLPMIMQYLDSPATTSAITYQVQVASDNSGTYTFNRRGADTNWSEQSTITVMEISGS